MLTQVRFVYVSDKNAYVNQTLWNSNSKIVISQKKHTQHSSYFIKPHFWRISLNKITFQVRLRVKYGGHRFPEIWILTEKPQEAHMTITEFSLPLGNKTPRLLISKTFRVVYSFKSIDTLDFYKKKY